MCIERNLFVTIGHKACSLFPVNVLTHRWVLWEKTRDDRTTMYWQCKWSIVPAFKGSWRDNHCMCRSFVCWCSDNKTAEIPQEQLKHLRSSPLSRKEKIGKHEVVLCLGGWFQTILPQGRTIWANMARTFSGKVNSEKKGNHRLILGGTKTAKHGTKNHHKYPFANAGLQDDDVKFCTSKNDLRKTKQATTNDDACRNITHVSRLLCFSKKANKFETPHHPSFPAYQISEQRAMLHKWRIKRSQSRQQMGWKGQISH